MSEDEASADADLYRLVTLRSVIKQRGGQGLSFDAALSRIRRAGT